jgi:hypothetical protein
MPVPQLRRRRCGWRAQPWGKECAEKITPERIESEARSEPSAPENATHTTAPVTSAVGSRFLQVGEGE